MDHTDWPPISPHTFSACLNQMFQVSVVLAIDHGNGYPHLIFPIFIIHPNLRWVWSWPISPLTCPQLSRTQAQGNSVLYKRWQLCFLSLMVMMMDFKTDLKLWFWGQIWETVLRYKSSAVFWSEIWSWCPVGNGAPMSFPVSSVFQTLAWKSHFGRVLQCATWPSFALTEWTCSRLCA